MKEKNPTNRNRKIGPRRKSKPEVRAVAPDRVLANRNREQATADQGEPIACVGIGASAGGLEAIKEFLHALPFDTGMAFIIIQHLEARHKSMLTAILSAATELPVAEAVDRTRVSSNRVYVIPPTQACASQTA